MSIHFDTQSSKYYLAMKGAPERILSRCDTVIFHNQDIKMTNDMKDVANKAIENLANTG